MMSFPLISAGAPFVSGATWKVSGKEESGGTFIGNIACEVKDGLSNAMLSTTSVSQPGFEIMIVVSCDSQIYIGPKFAPVMEGARNDSPEMTVPATQTLVSLIPDLLLCAY